eukprot:TRINITY_DN2315_c0_g1_i1.p2 TRINITY_DN2315_c0_g1~~TRINITY_DN2315_c0_g1_i1.p2  ORF type:complete len:205 (+),score=38.58 TRINITY_DN2315_c0_g1_i1:126-740(+)
MSFNFGYSDSDSSDSDEELSFPPQKRDKAVVVDRKQPTHEISQPTPTIQLAPTIEISEDTHYEPVNLVPEVPTYEPIKVDCPENILPPETEEECNIFLQEKIRENLAVGHRITQAFLKQNKEFGNPYLLNKICDHLKIEEHGTNYPSFIYDSQKYKKEDFIDEIKTQILEEQKKEQKKKSSKTSRWGPTPVVNMPMVNMPFRMR